MGPRASFLLSLFALGMLVAQAVAQQAPPPAPPPSGRAPAPVYAPPPPPGSYQAPVYPPPPPGSYQQPPAQAPPPGVYQAPAYAPPSAQQGPEADSGGGRSSAPEAGDAPRPFATLAGGIFYYQFFGGGFGATLGLHLLPNTVLEVDGYRASSALPSQKSDSVAVRVQQIFADHLYVRLGARHRWAEWTRELDFDPYEERVVQTDLGLDMAVGLRWDRDHLVLGFDGIGAYVPLKSFFSERQVVDTTNSEVLEADNLDLRYRWDVRLAYLYVGARF